MSVFIFLLPPLPPPSASGFHASPHASTARWNRGRARHQDIRQVLQIWQHDRAEMCNQQNSATNKLRYLEARPADAELWHKPGRNQVTRWAPRRELYAQLLAPTTIPFRQHKFPRNRGKAGLSLADSHFSHNFFLDPQQRQNQPQHGRCCESAVHCQR